MSQSYCMNHNSACPAPRPQVAELRRGCGDHMTAIEMLDRALAAAPPHHRIELLFLRGASFNFVMGPWVGDGALGSCWRLGFVVRSVCDGTTAAVCATWCRLPSVARDSLATMTVISSYQVYVLFPAGACHHALGFHRSAARDYSQAFTIEQKDSSNEVKMQQFLAFYQVPVSSSHAQLVCSTPQLCCLGLALLLHPVMSVVVQFSAIINVQRVLLPLISQRLSPHPNNELKHACDLEMCLTCRGSWRCTRTATWTASFPPTSWTRTSILSSRVWFFINYSWSVHGLCPDIEWVTTLLSFLRQAASTLDEIIRPYRPHAAAESWCKKGPPPPQLLTASALQPPFPAKEPAPPAAPKADVVGLFVKSSNEHRLPRAQPTGIGSPFRP